MIWCYGIKAIAQAFFFFFGGGGVVGGGRLGGEDPMLLDFKKAVLHK